MGVKLLLNSVSGLCLRSTLAALVSALTSLSNYFMSKIGRQPIHIPEGVTITMRNSKIQVSGPSGMLERILPIQITVKKGEDELKIMSKNKALWGTWRAHIANMVRGVTQGFEKRVEIHGIGYKIGLQGDKLICQVGFSHPVSALIPYGLACEVNENILTIRGIDKEKVGQFAAFVRSIKPPDSYKGKGIRYVGEVVKLKPGKRVGVGAV